LDTWNCCCPELLGERLYKRFLGQVYDVRGTALHCWTVLETFVHPLDRMKGHAQLWHTRVVLAIVPRTAKLLGWISQNVAPMNFPEGHESIPMRTGVGATTPPRAARSGWVALANSRAHPFYSSSSQSRRRLCGGHTDRNKSERRSAGRAALCRHVGRGSRRPCRKRVNGANERTMSICGMHGEPHPACEEGWLAAAAASRIDCARCIRHMLSSGARSTLSRFPRVFFL